jgi:hypothetical protein
MGGSTGILSIATGVANKRREGNEHSSWSDRHGLPATYEDWLKRAEFGFRHLKENRHTVERVMIDPATFPAWCRENGFELTSQARQRSAGTMVRAA